MKIFDLEVFENEGDNISIAQVNEHGMGSVIEISFYQVPILIEMLQDIASEINSGVNNE